MKTDFYTKTVLTVIAGALTIIAFQNEEIFTSANAGKAAGFISVPVNPDGSINVKFSETMKVNISEVGGNYIYNSIPINVKELDGSSISGSYGLPVNIKALSGSSIYDALPVKMKN
ncbi:MAG: hypothetical protein HY063_14550 [Bacteroidetes bacterium]|nr:hypothetical protein [Bacteroidota bacterium]